MDIDIGKRILNLRKSLNLPRYVFADKIMYNVKTVYRWEHNETEPSLTDLFCICKTFDINIKYFFDSEIEATSYLIDKGNNSFHLNKRFLCYVFPSLLSFVSALILLSFAIFYSTNSNINDGNSANNMLNKYSANSSTVLTLVIIASLFILIAASLLVLHFCLSKKHTKNKQTSLGF